MGNKVVKYISTILYCLGASSIIFYIYNIILYVQKNESMTKDIANSVQLYLVIGIALILLGIIIKLVVNILNNKSNIEELKEVEIKDDEKECRNCKAIINKDSYICPNCGYIEPRDYIEEEKPIDDEYINKYYNDDIVKEDKDKQALVIRILPKIFLMAFIVLCIYLVFTYTSDSNNINKVSDKKLEFLNAAIKIVEEIKYDEINYSDNKVYITLLDLDYVSDMYDSEDSYIVIDKKSKKYYLILSGINKYSDYSIEYTEISELDITKVLTNHMVTKDINNKLIIDNGDSVIIYNKN